MPYYLSVCIKLGHPNISRRCASRFNRRHSSAGAEDQHIAVEEMLLIRYIYRRKFLLTEGISDLIDLHFQSFSVFRTYIHDTDLRYHIAAEKSEACKHRRSHIPKGKNVHSVPAVQFERTSVCSDQKRVVYARIACQFMNISHGIIPPLLSLKAASLLILYNSFSTYVEGATCSSYRSPVPSRGMRGLVITAPSLPSVSFFSNVF